MSPPVPTPRGVKLVYQPAAALLWVLAGLSLVGVPFLLTGILDVVLLIVLVPVAWLLVDVLSGAVHWLLDRAARQCDTSFDAWLGVRLYTPSPRNRMPVEQPQRVQRERGAAP